MGDFELPELSDPALSRQLDLAAVFCGHPLAVSADNGLKFTSRAFTVWAHNHGERHIPIDPG